MGNDTSIMAFVKEKLHKSEQRGAPAGGGGSGGGGGGGKTNETSPSMISHNQKDVESHHGLILQRFDSADWAMMQKKGIDENSRMTEFKGSAKTGKSKCSDEKTFSPILKPPESSPVRSSPLGKPR